MVTFHGFPFGHLRIFFFFLQLRWYICHRILVLSDKLESRGNHRMLRQSTASYVVVNSMGLYIRKPGFRPWCSHWSFVILECYIAQSIWFPDLWNEENNNDSYFLGKRRWLSKTVYVFSNCELLVLSIVVENTRTFILQSRKSRSC